MCDLRIESLVAWCMELHETSHGFEKHLHGSVTVWSQHKSSMMMFCLSAAFEYLIFYPSDRERFLMFVVVCGDPLCS